MKISKSSLSKNCKSIGNGVGSTSIQFFAFISFEELLYIPYWILLLLGLMFFLELA